MGHRRKDDEILMEFGRRLRLQRESRGLALQALGKRLDLNPVVIGAYERAERNPTLGRVWEIAGGLGCSPAALLPLQEVDVPTTVLMELLDATDATRRAAIQIQAALGREAGL